MHLQFGPNAGHVVWRCERQWRIPFSVTVRGGMEVGLYARVVEETPDVLVTASVQGLVEFWKRGAESILGYPRNEAVGHSLAELVLSHRSAVDETTAHRDASLGRDPALRDRPASQGPLADFRQCADPRLARRQRAGVWLRLQLDRRDP